MRNTPKAIHIVQRSYEEPTLAKSLPKKEFVSMSDVFSNLERNNTSTHLSLLTCVHLPFAELSKWHHPNPELSAGIRRPQRWAFGV